MCVTAVTCLYLASFPLQWAAVESSRWSPDSGVVPCLYNLMSAVLHFPSTLGETLWADLWYSTLMRLNQIKRRTRWECKAEWRKRAHESWPAGFARLQRQDTDQTQQQTGGASHVSWAGRAGAKVHLELWAPSRWLGGPLLVCVCVCVRV